MFHGHHQVPGPGQAAQGGEQPVHFAEAQAPGGFVQQHGGRALSGAGQQPRQGQALPLPGGQGVLARRQVAQADVGQGLERPGDGGVASEDPGQVPHGGLQNLCDVEAAGPAFQDPGLEPPPLAVLAADGDVGQEVQGHGDQAPALAGLAPAAGGGGGEVFGGKVEGLGPGRGGEALAQRFGHAGEGGDGALAGRRRLGLVLGQQLQDGLVAFQAGAAHRLPALEPGLQGTGQHALDQAGLAAAGNAGDRHQGARREGDVEAAQVVQFRAAHGDPGPERRAGGRPGG